MGKWKHGSMEDAAPREDQAKRTEVMKARSFTIEASTDQLRCLICNNQHGYTESNGLMKLLTRLADYKTRY